jgi:hypothetical protein
LTTVEEPNTLTMTGGEEQIYSNLEVVAPERGRPLLTEAEKAVAQDSGLQIAGSDGMQHIEHSNIIHQETVETSERGRRSSRKVFAFLGVFIALIIILAAVLGGVLGSRHKSPEKPASASNGTTSNPPLPAFQHNIAAVSFTLDSINQTRLYYQSKVGEIVESVFQTDGNSWTHNPIGVVAMNGSALAAAVSRPDFPLVDRPLYGSDSS